MSRITTRAVCCLREAVAIRRLADARTASAILVKQSARIRAMPAGTKDDPWELSTAPRTSSYTMWADETADPPTLFCQVGSTQLKYQLRCIDDLHAWLVEQGIWVDLGAADEQKPAKEAPSRPGAAPRTIRSAAGTAFAKAIAVVSGCTCRRSWRPSARSSSPTTHATTRSAPSSEPRLGQYLVQCPNC
jgi:hypothetical protein